MVIYVYLSIQYTWHGRVQGGGGGSRGTGLTPPLNCEFPFHRYSRSVFSAFAGKLSFLVFYRDLGPWMAGPTFQKVRTYFRLDPSLCKILYTSVLGVCYNIA